MYLKLQKSEVTYIFLQIYLLSDFHVTYEYNFLRSQRKSLGFFVVDVRRWI